MTCRLNDRNGTALILASLLWAPGALAEDALEARLPTRAQLRQMVRDIEALPEPQRKARIQELYEQYGKPMRERLRTATYQPGQADEDTKVFVFKQADRRDLKIYIDFPPAGWQPTDRRPAAVFWHGGGFTQGGASQFYAQAKYLCARGMVVARPEYRLRDLDDTMPHHAIEDAISAMRWFKARAGEFGVDPERIAAGGGSAGGCIAAVLGTLDFAAFAEMGWIGDDEDRSIDPHPAAMILYNPFVDFFEPLNDRHVEEECLMNGEDPVVMRPLYHLLSAVEHLAEDSPPSIILFGTKDAFYPQQIRWIVKCRELGLTCHDYVYKGEVHSWYNNSPHLEYTTANVDSFLVEVGLLTPEPAVELPHKEVDPNRAQIQAGKYANKTDWDEMPEFRQYVEDHKIELIPFRHYER